MRWQCEHCNRDFTKSYALTQHISQKHPYFQDFTNQIVNIEEADDDIWNLPEYDSNYEYSTEYEVYDYNYLTIVNYYYYYFTILYRNNTRGVV